MGTTVNAAGYERTKTRRESPSRAFPIVDSIRIGDRVKRRIIPHLDMAETDGEEKAQNIPSNLERQAPSMGGPAADSISRR